MHLSINVFNFSAKYSRGGAIFNSSLLSQVLEVSLLLQVLYTPPDPTPSLLSIRVFINQCGESSGLPLLWTEHGGLQRVSWRPGGMWRKCGSVGRRHVDSTVGGKAGLETVPLSLDNVHSVSALLTWLDFFLCHLVGNRLVRISLHSANRFFWSLLNCSFWLQVSASAAYLSSRFSTILELPIKL